MYRIILALTFCSSWFITSAQRVAGDNKPTFGLEQDVLPYLAHGYYGAGWIGKNQIRVRILGARVTKPSFITPDGFVNNRVSAYALVCDYFLKPDWMGWWGGAGLVYWDSSIQKTRDGNTTNYTNTLINGSLGYQWKLYSNFYLSPWAGLHLRVGGAKNVAVDGDSFTTPFLNPEASLKVGWYFAQKK